MGQDAFTTALTAALGRWGLHLTDARLAALKTHFDLLTDANRRFNLTRITDPSEAAVKLYADSLSVLLWARAHASSVRLVLDVGTGAGFPALPLAVMSPEWRITAVDGTAKKVRFVATCIHHLELSNVQVLHTRAADLPASHPFDLVLFKAVGKLDRCLKEGRRLVARGGYIVHYKTASTHPDELDRAERLALRLGFAQAEPFRYELNLNRQRLVRLLRIYRAAE